MLCDDCLHADICENTTQGNCDWYLSEKLIRQKGEWVEENSETGAFGIKYTWFKCNQCGWNSSLVIPKNFCPNCGADMRKGGAE